MKSKKIMLLLSLGILGVLSPQRVLAQSETTQQEPLPILAETAVIENIGEDWQDNPIIDAKQLPVKQKREVFSPVFDPRGTIRETAVRNQGQVGICWAYATTDVLAIAKATQLGEKATFSPNYWNYRFAKNAFSDALNSKVYNGRNLDTGALSENVLFSANLGKNPVSENYFNTPSKAGANQPMLSQDFQLIENKADKSFIVTDTLIAPELSIAEAESKRLEKVAKIKSLVKNYGAVTYDIYTKTSFDVDDEKENSRFSQNKNGKYTSHVPLSEYNHVELNSAKNGVKINHVGTIVGWDDTFDKSMFKTQPKNNGAFIVKNTWGTSWGDKGYYYVSYEDMYTTLNRHVTSKVKKSDDETLKSYVTNYSLSFLPTTVVDDFYIANTYDVEKQDKTLKAVGFYNLHTGLKYEVYFTEKEIIKDKWNSIIDYEKIGEGTLTEVGLQKISVTEKELSNLKSYSIVVKIVNSKEIGEMKFPLQKVNENFDGKKEVVSAGKSFYSINISGERAYWWSLSNTSDSNKNYNSYINAYVKQEKSEVVEPVHISILNKTNHTYILHNYPEMLETEISSQKYTSSDLKWTSSDNDILTVDENGGVTGKGSGKVTVRVELKNDAKVYDTIAMTVDDHGDRAELATHGQLGQPMKVSHDWIIPAMVVSYSEWYDEDMISYTIPSDGIYTFMLEPQGTGYDFSKQGIPAPPELPMGVLATIQVNEQIKFTTFDGFPNSMKWLTPFNPYQLSLKKGDKIVVTVQGGTYLYGAFPNIPALKQVTNFTLSQEK
ncbi:hypothetical protein FACS1894193_13490 [Bacilli bacterium]|nr:hypothetical protein FACS1894192_02720 [Bacilli bacterium]GHU44736.1 hypothetical protein FACS1894193_13490 [Bacilli bacterium]